MQKVEKISGFKILRRHQIIIQLLSNSFFFLWKLYWSKYGLKKILHTSIAREKHAGIQSSNAQHYDNKRGIISKRKRIFVRLDVFINSFPKNAFLRMPSQTFWKIFLCIFRQLDQKREREARRAYSETAVLWYSSGTLDRISLLAGIIIIIVEVNHRFFAQKNHGVITSQHEMRMLLLKRGLLIM